MRTFAWVALSMLVAGIGGAVATWWSTAWLDGGLEPQPAEVLGNLTALGGVLAGVCGGIASVGRITTGDRDDLLTGLATLVLGVVAAGVINPGFLFAPFLLLRAPLQGIAAMCGGLAVIAALWGALRLTGIHDGSHPGSSGSIAAVKKLGCGSALVGSVLPLLAFLGGGPVIAWVSFAAFSWGIVLYGTALFTDVWTTLSNQAVPRCRDTASRRE